jgi:hypothetical protein
MLKHWLKQKKAWEGGCKALPPASSNPRSMLELSRLAERFPHNETELHSVTVSGEEVEDLHNRLAI